MKTARYITGEEAQVGDLVVSFGDQGRVILVGEGLLDWGLSASEIEEGRIMVEFEKMGHICQPAADEDLQFSCRS